MNKNLPIFNKKDEIINSVKNYDITIIQAETGSGKSTQVPQYLFEAGFNVICTQPRRIACVSLADRVNKEMGTNVVGYQTAFESTKTEDTKVLFCTDGLQMAKGIKESRMKDTVLIVDEVHEWNLNIETLIAWIRNEKKNGSGIKVVLMSATVECDPLVRYFKNVTSVNTIFVQNRTYHVNKTYSCKYEWGRILLGSLAKKENVLIFQAGKKEINDCIDDIHKMLAESQINAEVFPLHGELSIEDQNKCFNHFDVPKVIVATNIAQTSLTIDDVDTIIDFGEEKILNVTDGIEGLFVHHISKADCEQRAGRAGRTHEGNYYLCSDMDYEWRDDFSKPEIQRLLLDKVVLKLASVGLDASALRFFHQPDMDAIERAKNTLKYLNAFDKNGNITDLGREMVKIPCSSKSARMIIEANNLDCLDDIVTIVSILENGSLVNFKQGREVDTYFGVMEKNFSYSDFTNERNSDLIAELCIYDKIVAREFKNLKESGINSKNFFKIKAFRDKLERSISNLYTIEKKNRNNDNLTRCIVSGMIEDVFVSSYDYMDKMGNAYKLSNNSCVIGQMFVGQPIRIEYKNRFGCKCVLDLITNATKVNSDILMEYIDKSLIRVENNDCSAVYVHDEKKFMVHQDMYYGCIRIGSNVIDVMEGTEYFDTLKDIHSRDVERQENKYVAINGKLIDVVYFYNDNPYICIDENDLFAITDNCIKTQNGKSILITCGRHESYSIPQLKERILNDKRSIMNDNLVQGLPPKTGKLEDILKFQQFMGKKEIPEIGFVKYIGMKRDKGSVLLDTFSTEEECSDSTKEALEFVVMKEVNEKYNDKKFKTIVNGKKIETQKTIAAKEEFHENISLALEDISIDNLEERLDYIKDVFEDVIQTI